MLYVYITIYVYICLISRFIYSYRFHSLPMLGPEAWSTGHQFGCPPLHAVALDLCRTNPLEEALLAGASQRLQRWRLYMALANEYGWIMIHDGSTFAYFIIFHHISSYKKSCFIIFHHCHGTEGCLYVLLCLITWVCVMRWWSNVDIEISSCATLGPMTKFWVGQPQRRSVHASNRVRSGLIAR
jgi:hypothetical protein